MPSPLLSALRARTSDLHAALDAAVPPAASREAYVALLRGHLTVARVLEPVLSRALPEVAEPSRVAAIVRDLVALELAPDVAPEVAAVLEAPATAGPALLGVAYVVEGSTLGGLVLAQRYERALALPLGRATSFLRLRGEGTAARWRRFLAELADADAALTDADRTAACEAAAATFALYARALREHGALA